VANAGEFGSDGPLSWGRWQGAATIGADKVSFSSKEGLHYVSGVPTPNISSALGTITYTLIGATTPTLNNASGGPGESFSGTLKGDFISNRVAVDATVSTGRATSYSMVTPGGLSDPKQSPVTIDPAKASFGGTFVVGGAGCASAPCAAAVQGGFFGKDATHAGMTYQITAPAGVVSGAAAFRQ
jgi:hypothetical protein